MVVGRSTGGRVESTQLYRVGWSPFKRGLSLQGKAVGLSTGGRVESIQ